MKNLTTTKKNTKEEKKKGHEDRSNPLLVKAKYLIFLNDVLFGKVKTKMDTLKAIVRYPISSFKRCLTLLNENKFYTTCVLTRLPFSPLAAALHTFT